LDAALGDVKGKAKLLPRTSLSLKKTKKKRVGLLQNAKPRTEKPRASKTN
jgi:hypothetical protein